ncbi:hypothetical protein QGM71_08950 [Virgibacillus sp. C22-A2]|uniref:Uncharacterized protein n=1 Tax=Virgibacillus tibetensis TaxID=3042313 RepID=A0ABU6KGL1_9BACI|nr:hypothetical protein [Virgibacillus sp. C22-A2]
MTYLVVNCNQWIGFHITESLLDDGRMVHGVINETIDDSLTMFFGRNSSFTLAEPVTSEFYENAVIIHDVKDNTEIQAKRKIFIDPSDRVKDSDSIVSIKAPLLFGEWMPMNENGLYSNNKFIRFDSPYFKQNAVYIKDFTKSLLSWLEKSKLQSEIVVKSSSNRTKEDVKLENSIYIRDNVPTEENLERVLNHFKLYSKFY